MPGGSGAWSEIVFGRQREALERKLALGGEKASDQPTHEQAAAPAAPAAPASTASEQMVGENETVTKPPARDRSRIRVKTHCELVL